MDRTYPPLKAAFLEPGAGYVTPAHALPARVRMESPAIEVMTDLRLVAPVTIDPHETIDAANTRMIVNRVRLLLVTGVDGRVVGLFTATDFLGEKPMQFIQHHGGTHGEILVKDIMTPQAHLEVLSLADVLAAKVGHVVETLRARGRQHALVVDADEDRRQRVRGIFSVTQIARQLGIQIQTQEIVRTFAEIEGLLSH